MLDKTHHWYVLAKLIKRNVKKDQVQDIIYSCFALGIPSFMYEMEEILRTQEPNCPVISYRGIEKCCPYIMITGHISTELFCRISFKMISVEYSLDLIVLLMISQQGFSKLISILCRFFLLPLFMYFTSICYSLTHLPTHSMHTHVAHMHKRCCVSHTRHKTFVFWLRFHWNLFPMAKLMTNHHLFK